MSILITKNMKLNDLKKNYKLKYSERFMKCNLTIPFDNKKYDLTNKIMIFNEKLRYFLIVNDNITNDTNTHGIIYPPKDNKYGFAKIVLSERIFKEEYFLNWALAHELGHYNMNHGNNNKITAVEREIEADNIAMRSLGVSEDSMIRRILLTNCSKESGVFMSSEESFQRIKHLAKSSTSYHHLTEADSILYAVKNPEAPIDKQIIYILPKYGKKYY